MIIKCSKILYIAETDTKRLTNDDVKKNEIDHMLLAQRQTLPMT